SRSNALQRMDISAKCTADEGRLGPVHYRRGTYRSSALHTRDVSAQCNTDKGHFGLVYNRRGASQCTS
ncbi:hypothetical protein LSAT2_020663, partial [Lamellibrachia satsuma]